MLSYFNILSEFWYNLKYIVSLNELNATKFRQWAMWWFEIKYSIPSVKPDVIAKTFSGYLAEKQWSKFLITMKSGNQIFKLHHNDHGVSYYYLV